MRADWLYGVSIIASGRLACKRANPTCLINHRRLEAGWSGLMSPMGTRKDWIDRGLSGVIGGGGGRHAGVHGNVIPDHTKF